MNLWTTTPTPCFLTRALARMSLEEMEEAVRAAVEDSRDEVERLTKPYSESWRRTQELCRPFWYGHFGAK